MTSASVHLAAFAANLRFDVILAPVVRKANDLLADWFGSAVTGRGTCLVESIIRFGRSTVGTSVPSVIITRRASSNPYLSAIANSAASHVAEQDDVHSGSVIHPASVAGYDVGIHAGEFLGRSRHRICHTTGTKGTFAATATVGKPLGLDARQMRHAVRSTATQPSDPGEFLCTAADSEQVQTAHAAVAVLTSAYLTRERFPDVAEMFEGPQGMEVGMSIDADPSRLNDNLGVR